MSEAIAGTLEELPTGREEATRRLRIDTPRIGRLVGISDNGTVPLVTYDGQATSAAIPARTTIDVHGAHVGQEVVLMFEGGDPARPLVIGCLHDPHPQPIPTRSGVVEMDVDGERLIVSAKDQLVLRCGKASITLTKAGKVMIQGLYVLSQSAGVNRIKGGAVQLN
jgi:uncharacterized protein DUF6484